MTSISNKHNNKTTSSTNQANRINMIHITNMTIRININRKLETFKIEDY